MIFYSVFKLLIGFIMAAFFVSDKRDKNRMTKREIAQSIFSINFDQEPIT
jgi:hypothetical protein